MLRKTIKSYTDAELMEEYNQVHVFLNSFGKSFESGLIRRSPHYVEDFRFRGACLYPYELVLDALVEELLKRGRYRWDKAQDARKNWMDKEGELNHKDEDLTEQEGE